MCPGPLSSSRNSSWLILLPSLRHLWCKRIIGVRRAEESLDREEDGSDLEGWGPVAYEIISLVLDFRIIKSGYGVSAILLSTSRQIRPSLSMFGW